MPLSARALGRGSTIKDNSASTNGSDGIYAGIVSVVVNDTTEENGGNGIYVAGGGSAQGNVSRLNTLYGLYLSGATLDKPSYVGNTLSKNVVGQVIGGIEIGPNLCDGSTVCP
jgi:hypothetical protein